MTFVANAPKYLIVALLGAGVAVTMWQLLAPAEKPKSYIVDVTEPELSFAGREGKALFDTNCAPCHGLKAAGTDHGPPLVHDIMPMRPLCSRPRTACASTTGLMATCRLNRR